MTPTEALAILRESCDADHDARIWADGGKRITALARLAGVRVEYVHCDLTKQASERRIVERKEVTA